MRAVSIQILLAFLTLAAACSPEPVPEPLPAVSDPDVPSVPSENPETPEPFPEGRYQLRDRLPAMAVAQSLAVHGDKMFTVSANEQVTVTDLVTYKQLGTFSLPLGSHSALHANTCCFGKHFAREGDEFPLFYVSQWFGDEERGVLVYRITRPDGKYRCELVQAIIPDPSMEKIGKGSADWVVDTDSGYLYCFAYKLIGNTSTRMDGNAMIVTQFDLPSPDDGPEVTLTDGDVVRSAELDMMLVTQDKCYRNGEIFIVSGSHTVAGSLRLRSLSLLTLTVTRDIDLSVYGGEPQGLDFGPDGKLLGSYYYVPCLYHYSYESLTEDHSGYLQGGSLRMPE